MKIEQNHLKKQFILIFFLLLSNVLLPNLKSGKYMCVGVSDGDTIWITNNGERIRVKIDGVDCPELGQEFGRKAKQFTSDLVIGKLVEVNVRGVDESRTPVAYILIEKRDISVELLEAGLAWNLKRNKSDDPVYAYVEKDAKKKKIGLWSSVNPIAPWDFREEALLMINNKVAKTPLNNAPNKNINVEKSLTPISEEGESGSNGEIKGNTNPLSIYEEKRALGVEQFEKEVIELAKKADQMDIEYTRYNDACLNKFTSGNILGNTSGYAWGRKWFVYWEGGFSGGVSINNESTPECLKIWSDFSRLVREIKTGMESSMEKARKAGVYPGQLRKVRERYYLDWSGWD